MSRESEAGFLSRWSRRKLENENSEPHQNEPLSETDEKMPADTASQADEADKQHESLPVWQREDVDTETKKAILRTLFRKPEFNIRDGLNEYDDDFTQFSGLGDIVPHDMKRMLELAEKQTRSSSSTKNESLSGVEETHREDESKEDNDLA